MGFRFRRSVRLFPGLRLNFSKSGISASLGGRGGHFTIGPKGTRATAGIPGTGLSWTEYTPYSSHHRAAQPDPYDEPIITPGESEPLTPIESAAPDRIGALSTSELAPILNTVRHRMPLLPTILVVSGAILFACFYSGNHLLAESAVAFAAVFGIAAYFVDRYRRSIRIEYELDAAAKEISDALAKSFADLQSCSYIWNVTARGATSDWKRNAGATELTNRKRTYAVLKRPECVRGDVKFPSIKVGYQELYFLPDALLVVSSNLVTALQYRDFSIAQTRTKFIEDAAPPGDTQVVGHTWRFANKQGGPDRRFNNNAQLPVCLYGELTFTSPGGLNCLLHLSNPEAGERFFKVDEVLHSYDAAQLGSKSFKSLTEAKRWPTVALLISFLICGVTLSGVAVWQIPGVRSEMAKTFHQSAATPQPPAPVYQPPPQPIVTPVARDPAPIPRDRPMRR